MIRAPDGRNREWAGTLGAGSETRPHGRAFGTARFRFWGAASWRPAPYRDVGPLVSRRLASLIARPDPQSTYGYRKWLFSGMVLG